MIRKDIKYICKDFTKIENYEKAVKDTRRMWECHHRLETHNSDGERRSVDILHSELIALGIYYDRPPEELIFLTKKEHDRLHSKGKKRSDEIGKRISRTKKGKPMSEETKRKQVEAHKGKKHGPMSEETKRKISEAQKDRPKPEEWKAKMKGKPKSEETKRRISETLKDHPGFWEGKKRGHWFNNGVTSVLLPECPEGFVPGRLH